MSTTTDVLSLFKYDPVADADSTFNITQGLNNNWDKLDAALLLAIAAAGAYNPEESYAVGDYCTYKGKLHKCSTAIPTGETWTEAHWTTTTVAAELAELSSQLSNKLNSRAFTVIDVSTDLHTLEGGTYFAQGTVSTEDNWPYNGWFMGLIVSFRNDAQTNSHGGLFLFYENDNGIIYYKSHYYHGWGEWKTIPTDTKPQEYSLQLAEGISTYGKSTYWKTYDGICFINFALTSTQPITNESVIATLPVGFRPSVTVFAGSHGYLEANTGARVAIDVEVRLNGSIVIWTEDPLSNISGFIGFIADS